MNAHEVAAKMSEQTLRALLLAGQRIVSHQKYLAAEKVAKREILKKYDEEITQKMDEILKEDKENAELCQMCWDLD